MPYQYAPSEAIKALLYDLPVEFSKLVVTVKPPSLSDPPSPRSNNELEKLKKDNETLLRELAQMKKKLEEPSESKIFLLIYSV
jgi:hypothetical protein